MLQYGNGIHDITDMTKNEIKPKKKIQQQQKLKSQIEWILYT